MKKNRKRTFTTFLGIVFMVLLMTCVFVGKDTAIEYMEQVASQKEGKWHVALYNITEKEQKEAEQLEEVEQTAVSVNYGLTEFPQSANELRPYLNVKGYQADCFDWMNIKLKSGRLPENANEVVISDAIMTDGANIAIGDTIKAEYFIRSITGINKGIKSTFFPFQNINLEYGQTIYVSQDFPYYEENKSFQENRDYTGKKQELTVVGIIEIPGYEASNAAGYTAITMLDENEITKLDKFNLSIKLDLERLSSTLELQELLGECEMDFNNYVLAFSGKSSDSTINVLFSFFTVFFVIFIIFASVFLIYNMFNMSFEERSRYLGMLSSIGATGKQKRSSIYYEAFYLLLFALPVGILSGFGIVKLGMTALQPFFYKILSFGQYVKGISIILSISWEAIVIIVLISIVTVFISACLPARKIGKIGSIECIRGNTNKKSKQYKMKTYMVKCGNAEHMLAASSLKRQSKKTKSITAAAVTFMVIMIVTSFGCSAIEKAINEKAGNSSDIKINFEKWDYYLESGSEKEKYESLKKEIERADGIEKTTEWYSGMFAGRVPTDCYSQEYWTDVYDIFHLYKLSDEEFNEMIAAYHEKHVINVLGVDSETLEKIAKATGTNVEILKNTDTPAAIVMQEGVVSTSDYIFDDKKPERYRFFDIKQMTDKKIGDNLPVELYSQKEDKMVDFPIQIAGYAVNEQLKEFVTFHSPYLCLIVSVDIAKQINEITENLDAALYIKTSEENSDILNRLQKLSDLGNNGYILFMRTDYVATVVDAIVGIVRILLSCFVLLTSIICILNLFNSIRSRINGRGSEFAIMESIGMTKKQIEKMLLYESIGIVLKSVIYAGCIAFPLMYMIQYGITKIFGTMTLMFPWSLMITAVLITMIVVVILTEYCFKKEKHESIMERIRNENV